MPKSTFVIVPILLVAAIFSTEIASNIYVPSLPFLVRYFSVTQQDVNLTLSVNLLGLCLSGILYGPLSDSFGRKRVFIAGMSIFTLGTLACAVATSITFLILARFFQGLGGAVSCIVGIVMIKDIFDEERCPDILSMIYFVIALAPAMSPIMGGYISESFGWQANFYLVGLVSAIVVGAMLWALPETLPAQERIPFLPQSFLANYWTVATNPVFLGYALISALTYAGLWAYIAGVPYVFINQIGLTSAEFGYIQAVLVVAYLIGSYFNKKLFIRFGTLTLLCMGLILTFCGGIGLVISSLVDQQSVVTIIAPMFIFALGMGGVFSNTVTKALHVFPRLRGSASATLSSLEALLPVVTTYLVGVLSHESLRATSLVVAGCASLTLCIYMALHLWPVRLRLRRPDRFGKLKHDKDQTP
jgi:DHA1 family bicyclomycin/chloramphenicol resistance-like MFS transporter